MALRDLKLHKVLMGAMIRVMSYNKNTKETLITTNEGVKLVRRERVVRMPNGKLRHPVDYYDATPGAVEVTPEERERIRIPIYQILI